MRFENLTKIIFGKQKQRRNGRYSRGGHIGHRQQFSYFEPRVEMFGNEFRWGKTKVSHPSELNIAAA